MHDTVIYTHTVKSRPCKAKPLCTFSQKLTCTVTRLRMPHIVLCNCLLGTYDANSRGFFGDAGLVTDLRT